MTEAEVERQRILERRARLAYERELAERDVSSPKEARPEQGSGRMEGPRRRLGVVLLALEGAVLSARRQLKRG